MDEIEFWLRLLLVPGLGRAKLRNLYHLFSDKWRTCTPDQLRFAGLSSEQCQAFSKPDKQRFTKTQAWLAQPAHTLLTLNHSHYPEALRTLCDPPILLFVAGNTALLNKPQISMVGSRTHTIYGKRWGSYFAEQLASSGLIITSGLAIGIDSICHQGALRSGGQTVAVLGNGLANPYPLCNRNLAQRILCSGGALVSEYLPDLPALAKHFPQRNRIISGLSIAVLVVEATRRSGSLITVRHALEQGREVFALPGPLENKNSQGCHKIIKQGACLVTSPDELLEELNSSLRWLSLPAIPQIKSHLTTNDLSYPKAPFPEIIMHINQKVTPIDIIADRAGQLIPDLLTKLTELELAGWITAVPGGYILNKAAN